MNYTRGRERKNKTAARKKRKQNYTHTHTHIILLYFVLSIWWILSVEFFSLSLSHRASIIISIEYNIYSEIRPWHWLLPRLLFLLSQLNIHFVFEHTFQQLVSCIASWQMQKHVPSLRQNIWFYTYALLFMNARDFVVVVAVAVVATSFIIILLYQSK